VIYLASLIIAKAEVIRPVALVSFDLDGVLQRNPFHGRSPHGVFGHIRRELGPYVTGQPDSEAAELAALDLVMTEHQARLYADQLVAAHDWDGIVAVVASRLGYPGNLDVTALVTDYCQRPGLVFLYPGAAEALDALLTAGHTLVTVTNGFRCYQEPVLRTLGILDRFGAMITPEVAGSAKPQPGIFRAAEACGGPPHIHIGDVLPHDVAGARRAGWKAIYVVQPGAPGYTELPADLAALPPWQRPASGGDWLRTRLAIDRRWHGHPPAELEECMPDAIVTHLSQIPEAVAQISAA
jgi:putative hydrolase of the HAD superfamily